METSDGRKLDSLIGESDVFLELLDQLSQVAPLSKPVLVVGERGTGKELIGERLHFLSERWDRPLAKLNCAAINEELLESELFGHVSGAFTGASRAREGRFEAVDGGTMFLDELASMSTRLQEKLLRVIEYGEFQRVGSNETRVCDVRIIGAANVDLPAMATRGEFREDLLDRLSFDVITLPPLRARRDDILPLAQAFAEGMVKQLHREVFPGFSPSVMSRLEDFAWPGNVRQLKNVVERAVYRTDDDKVVTRLEFDPFESPWRPASKASAVESDARFEQAPTTSFPCDFKERVSALETRLLSDALLAHEHNQRRTAKALGLSYDQLRGLLKKYDLN